MGQKRFKIYTRILARSWRVLFGFAVPIVLSPLLRDWSNKTNLGAYILLLMVLYWMFEPINLYITALIPAALFPLMDIASTEDISKNYMKSANMLFFGGLIIGISLEYSNLHKRISLKTVIWFGSSIKSLLAGVMLVTMFLSMWINNTATTAMMIPIVDSILLELDETKKTANSANLNESTGAALENGTNDKDLKATDKMKKLRKAFLLSIAYSANIGGTATLTGTGTNLVFQDVFNEEFPKATTVLSFTTWFFYAFPSALLTVGFAWMLLYFLYARIPNEPREAGQRIKRSALEKYQALGPMTFHEYAVLVHFILLILLWFAREPLIFPGWGHLVSDKKDMVKDATPAILATVMMFLIPKNFKQFFTKDKPEKIERLLEWKIVKEKMSWGVVLLLGGGFALAYGTKESGLSHWLSQELDQIESSVFVTLLVLVVCSACITEMASNVATASVVLPVVARLAVTMDTNPLLFMIPVTISISFAFMFPVSTPPNAIVYSYLGISISEMVRPGAMMNIIAITTQLAWIHLFGKWLFNLDQFPDWAKDPSFNITTTTAIPYS